LPKCVNFDVIDKFEKVTDKDGLVWQRKLAREEGILVGNSAGSAVKGILQLKDHLKPEDVVVVLFHDHATRYMGKAFNDDWMKDRGFLDSKPKTALDLISSHQHLPLITVLDTDLAKSAFDKMEKYSISQLPVVNEAGDFIGSLNDHHIFRLLLNNLDAGNQPVSEIMQAPFPIVSYYEEMDSVSKSINKENPAVMVEDLGGVYHIITKYDLISALAK